MKMSFVVDVQWVKNHLDQVVLLDVRFALADVNAGRKAYEAGHLPGAIYLDSKNDLAQTPGKHGGNHPLPRKEDLAQKLGAIGIDEETKVVVYDNGGDMFAPRAWWVLQYIGHQQTYLLDGGLQAWVEAGNKLSTESPEPREPKTFTPHIRPEQTVQMEEVQENIMKQDALLIDSRAQERYLGKTEPLYDQSGHIPGAINYFWKEVFQEDGTLKSKEALQEIFASLAKDEPVIVSCGSGVSACANIIGLKRAGFQKIKLYPGSFSDWISYPDNTLEQGSQ